MKFPWIVAGLCIALCGAIPYGGSLVPTYNNTNLSEPIPSAPDTRWKYIQQREWGEIPAIALMRFFSECTTALWSTDTTIPERDDVEYPISDDGAYLMISKVKAPTASAIFARFLLDLYTNILDVRREPVWRGAELWDIPDYSVIHINTGVVYFEFLFFHDAALARGNLTLPSKPDNQPASLKTTPDAVVRYRLDYKGVAIDFRTLFVLCQHFLGLVPFRHVRSEHVTLAEINIDTPAVNGFMLEVRSRAVTTPSGPVTYYNIATAVAVLLRNGINPSRPETFQARFTKENEDVEFLKIKVTKEPGLSNQTIPSSPDSIFS